MFAAGPRHSVLGPSDPVEGERAMTDVTQMPEQAASEQVVAEWLDAFNAALAAGDAVGAAELFAPDGFWRDLVALTWNIKTLEGRDEIRAMLEARLADRGARAISRVTEPPARGRRRDRSVARVRDRGRPRPRPSAAARRPRLDAADHAVRAQGPRGAARPAGGRWAPSTASTPTASRGWSGASARPSELGYADAARGADRSAAARAGSRSARGCASSTSRRS